MISLALLSPTLSQPRDWYWQLPICARTMGKYAHCELVIGEANRTSLCYSATLAEGVRFATRDLRDTKAWTIIPLTLTDWQESYMHNIFNETVGAHYDTKGIIGYLLANGIHTTNNLFCSAACYSALVRVGYFGDDQIAVNHWWTVSPSELAKLVAAKEKK